jgi:hypothetical protein
VSFFKPAATVQPEAEQEQEQPEEPMDFRFALERFNDSPKPRQRQ